MFNAKFMTQSGRVAQLCLFLQIFLFQSSHHPLRGRCPAPSQPSSLLTQAGHGYHWPLTAFGLLLILGFWNLRSTPWSQRSAPWSLELALWALRSALSDLWGRCSALTLPLELSGVTGAADHVRSLDNWLLFLFCLSLSVHLSICLSPHIYCQ